MPFALKWLCDKKAVSFFTLLPRHIETVKEPELT